MRRAAHAAAGLAVLALAAGCGVPAQDKASVAADDSVPFSLLDPTADPIVPPPRVTPTEPAALCFVQNQALVVVTTEVDSPVRPGEVVTALASPPPGVEPLRTALSDPTVVSRVEIDGGIARVDLRQAISTLGGEDQLLAVAQIVCTLTALPGVGQVSFTLEGTPVDVPRGDGSLAAAPVSRDDYASLLP